MEKLDGGFTDQSSEFYISKCGFGGFNLDERVVSQYPFCKDCPEPDECKTMYDSNQF